MTEAQATLAGLIQIWESTGTKKQNQMAIDIVDDLRSKGVTAEVIAVESKILSKKLGVWRDKDFHARLKLEGD